MYDVQVDTSTRQRLGLDVPTLPNSRPPNHTLVIDLLDPDFIKKVGPNYNGRYRRVQWALGHEHSLPLDVIGGCKFPILPSDWKTHESHLQSLLRENGSPDAVVEFVKVDVHTRKVGVFDQFIIYGSFFFTVWRRESDNKRYTGSQYIRFRASRRSSNSRPREIEFKNLLEGRRVSLITVWTRLGLRVWDKMKIFNF